jgi:ABC-2 type transport system ATP-binding protein
MTLPALEFHQVSKRYGRADALKEVSFSVAAGECFGLVGENGAGKTTLLKCLLDFCEADSGDIHIMGTPHRAPHARAPLAFLPERFVPPYYLTGRDFLRYMLALQNLPYREEDAARMLAALDLDHAVLARPVRDFSKGMTQKLGLAACLLSGKAVTVLDEPASGLDPKARALLKKTLRHLKAEGRTVFLTSHALADVAELCDRMAVLHQGKLQFAGTPAELRERTGETELEQAFLHCIGALPL